MDCFSVFYMKNGFGKKKKSRKQNATLMDTVEMNALFVLLTLT